ncbi:MAG: flavodoxin family protein [Opitutales bacterium]
MDKQIYIINGSPRKNWNTAHMCKSFSQGAETKGINTEIINLYDINFKGCRSCFACKLKGGKNFGKCSYPDELTPILDKISYSDGLVFATPIYFGDVTGAMRSLLERLAFPFFEYKAGYPSIAPRKFPTAVIYTMNVTEDLSNQMYHNVMEMFEWAIETAFTKPVRICAWDTYQFNDYSKYEVECFDVAHKKKQHNEQFPKDLQNAFNQGIIMAEKILNT